MESMAEGMIKDLVASGHALADDMTGAPSVSASPTLYCSFCNKSQHAVKKLIAGDAVFICDECVDVCNRIIRGEKEGSAR